METLDKHNSNNNAASTFKLSTGWMKFLAILSLVAAGLTILGSFGQMQYIPMMGIVSFLSGGVYCVMGIFLLNYANATGNYGNNPTSDSLENMASHHTKYWKLTGILVICLVGLSIIMAVVMAAMFSSYGGAMRYFDF